MSEDEQERELFNALGADPVIKEAVDHYNTQCERNEENSDGCPICVGLQALGVLEETSDQFKAPAFVKRVRNVPEVLAVMQKLTIWFAEATSDFLDFVAVEADFDEEDEDGE